MNRRHGSQELLLAELAQLRLDARDALRGESQNTIKVVADPILQRYAIEQDWDCALRPEQRTWLTAYAGIVSIVRFAAYFPGDFATQAAASLARGKYCATDEWAIVESVSKPRMSFSVELFGAPLPGTPAGFLVACSPDDRGPEFHPEPITLLREFLIRTTDELDPGFVEIAYEHLATACESGELDNSSLSKAVTAQLNLPLELLRRAHADSLRITQEIRSEQIGCISRPSGAQSTC